MTGLAYLPNAWQLMGETTLEHPKGSTPQQWCTPVLWSTHVGWSIGNEWEGRRCQEKLLHPDCNPHQPAQCHLLTH